MNETPNIIYCNLSIAFKEGGITGVIPGRENQQHRKNP
jgi:hypothetical protein